MIYRAFPDFAAVDRRWDCVLPALYTDLLKHAVVYTEAERGVWVEPRHAVFNTLSESEPQLAAIILAVLAAAAVRVADCPPHVLKYIAVTTLTTTTTAATSTTTTTTTTTTVLNTSTKFIKNNQKILYF